MSIYSDTGHSVERIEQLSKVLARTKPEIKWVINEQKMWAEIQYYTDNRRIFTKALDADKVASGKQ